MVMLLTLDQAIGVRFSGGQLPQSTSILTLMNKMGKVIVLYIGGGPMDGERMVLYSEQAEKLPEIQSFAGAKFSPGAPFVHRYHRGVELGGVLHMYYLGAFNI